MEGGGSQACEGLTVLRGAISGMALQSITWKAPGQAADQGIPFLLGHHTGCGDRGAVQIPFDQGALGPLPAP